MSYALAAMIAALMVLESACPAWACRSNSILAKPSLKEDVFTKAGPDQFTIKLEPGANHGFYFLEATSHDIGFCIDLTVLDSPDIQNTWAGVLFWGRLDDPNNCYTIYVRNGEYAITHSLFGKTYELVPWTKDVSIKTGIGQKNEVEVWLTLTNAEIAINGTAVNKIVARPAVDAQQYGIAFQTSKGGTTLFQIGSPRIVN